MRRVEAERSGGRARKRMVRMTMGKRMMISGGLSKGGDECQERRWGMVVGGGDEAPEKKVK